MAKRPVGVRVDENLYKAFKLQAVLEGRTTEEALALALLQYLNNRLPVTLNPGEVGIYLEYRKAMQGIEEILSKRTLKKAPEKEQEEVRKVRVKP